MLSAGLYPSLRKQAIAALGIFTASPLAARNQSSYLVRQPSPTAQREVPTPLVFLSAQRWEAESGRGFTKLSAMYAERGYTCIQIDLAPPDETPADSGSLMAYYEKELASHVRLAAIPFPPVLFARSAGCLIAQTYISSHPASALVLLSPPPTTSSASPGLLPTPLQEFDYEPRFPVVVVDTAEGAERQRKENRIVRDDGVEVIVVRSLEGQEALMQMEKWMDRIGI